MTSLGMGDRINYACGLEVDWEGTREIRWGGKKGSMGRDNWNWGSLGKVTWKPNTLDKPWNILG